MLQKIKLFTGRYPAFFYGFFFFLGCLFALCSYWPFFTFLLFLFLVEKKHFFLLTLTFLFPLPLISHLYNFELDKSKVEGKFYISKISDNARFSSHFAYQGILKTADKKRALCQLYHPEKLDSRSVYNIKGILRKKDSGIYTIKLIKEIEISSEKKFPLADIRYKAKKKIKDYVQRHIAQKRAASFLSALATGELEDRSIGAEFGKLGLSHIMAISGFHFGLIAFFFHFFLRLFLPYKINALILIFILTAYFIFLGNCPSVFRAWIFSLVVLLGNILERKSYAINSLGIAAIITLLCTPTAASTLSFQLSFLATAGILFFYSPVEKRLQLWIPKLGLKEVMKKNFFSQIFYFAASLFRDSISLILAVHIPLLPLLLFAFNSFPFNSLVYNLFFPFFTSISMLLFLLGCALGSWLHKVNGFFTEWILKIPESPPLLFKSLYAEVPAWVLTVYLSLLLVTAIRVNITTKVIVDNFD